MLELDHGGATLWDALGLSREENEEVMDAVLAAVMASDYPSQALELLANHEGFDERKRALALVYLGMVLAHGKA